MSAIGKNVSSASNTTTSEPRRRHTEPNSKPITPAPMTPRRLGTSGNFNAPVESTIKSSSTGATGILTGTEPVARITYFGSKTCTSPSNGVNSTFLPASNLPVPCNHSIPLPFSN